MVILALWLFVILPLTLVGAVIGRNVDGAPQSPCRISPIPRPIPEKKWFVSAHTDTPLASHSRTSFLAHLLLCFQEETVG